MAMMQKAQLIHDKDDENVYRVEAIDDDGGCEVAVFSGPNALDRAHHFAACAGYYDEWGATATGLTEWIKQLD